jgi:hypothetical protein
MEILFVCPVQFVFTELQSGSNFLLGVHSKPRTHKILALVDCAPNHSRKRNIFASFLIFELIRSTLSK